MLSGNAANDRPDIDELHPVPLGIVTHASRKTIGRAGTARISAGPIAPIGVCDPETGMYQAAANQLTEDERRAAGLRRNGRPRRNQTT